MKNKATPTLHDNDQPNAVLAGDNSGARQIFKLGLDVDLNNAVTEGRNLPGRDGDSSRQEN
ncbi:MAG TPA: hypothetical protein VH229_03840 [Candidatus Udaeobacter sp.]|jgi:hypothetical protein|nr:hypothetical protein [Candidatus Udaeobacter sp.]